MNEENLTHYVESMDWFNPKSKLKTRLGDHIGDGRFINFTYPNLDFELSLLDNPKNEKMIGAGQDGNVFLHQNGNNLRAVKVYRRLGTDTKGTGISQFRVSRKLKQLGYETPNVYVASENVLVMEYLPYENLHSYIHKQSDKDKVFLHNKWIDMMNIMWKEIGRERIDRALVNGYIRPRVHLYDLGIIGQG